MRPRLIEKVLDLNKDAAARFLYRKYIDEAGWKKRHLDNSHRKVYCVYLNAKICEPESVIFRFVSEKPEYPLLFKEFINQTKPKSLLEAQFLIGFYEEYYSHETPFRNSGLQPWECLDQLRFEPDQLLDDLLAESQGVLLWNYQYKQLLDFVEPDFVSLHPNILLDLGRNEHHYWNQIQATQINGKSLETMIRDRLIFNYTRYPPLQSAWTLWKYLSNRGNKEHPKSNLENI